MLLIFQFCSFWLLTKFDNTVVQLKCYLLDMLTGPEKIVRRIVFLFSFFKQNSRWPTNHMLLSRAASPEAYYPGNMLITFWFDSDITFLRGLH